MRNARLGLVPYVVVWGGVCAAQAAAAWYLVGGRQWALGVLVIFALQVAKVPVAGLRAGDLGRPWDDGILALTPLANLGLAWQLLQRTPKDAVREKRRAKWVGQMTAFDAFIGGVQATGKALPLVLLVAMLAAGVFTGVELWLVDQVDVVKTLAPETQTTWLQAIGVLEFFLVVYLVLQFFKRKTASRISWVPTLFILPIALVATPLLLTGTAQGDAVVAGFPVLGWSLLWFCIGEAALATVWVTLAAQHHRGEKVQMGKALGALRRTLEVAGPHGAAAHAIYVGMQVIVPGIVYALQLAFVDAIVVLHPEHRSMSRSAALTRPIRRRIFKLLYIGFLGLVITFFGGMVAVEIAFNMPPAAEVDVKGPVLQGEVALRGADGISIALPGAVAPGDYTVQAKFRDGKASHGREVTVTGEGQSLDCKLAIRACELVDRDVLTDTVASTGMHFIGLAAPGKSRVIPLAFLITAFLGGVFWAPIKAGLTLMYLERVANRRKEAAPDDGAKPAGEVA